MKVSNLIKLLLYLPHKDEKQEN